MACFLEICAMKGRENNLKFLKIMLFPHQDVSIDENPGDVKNTVFK